MRRASQSVSVSVCVWTSDRGTAGADDCAGMVIGASDAAMPLELMPVFPKKKKKGKKNKKKNENTNKKTQKNKKTKKNLPEKIQSQAHTPPPHPQEKGDTQTEVKNKNQTKAGIHYTQKNQQPRTI